MTNRQSRAEDGARRRDQDGSAGMPAVRHQVPGRGGRAAAVPFLPMTRVEMSARGWSELDVLLVSGDAYVDHPAFGIPLLGRWLEAHGYRVGIIAQPRWDTPEDILRLGRPRLFCGISAGCLDSMLAHYTAFRKKRHDDAYTPGGGSGARPNRASIVYSNLVRAAFPGLPVVLGGIEASLRRHAHYDFWSDALRRSILFDSKADLLVYGMGERAILEITRRLAEGVDLRGIPGSAVCSDSAGEAILLPAYEAIAQEPRLLLETTRTVETVMHQGRQTLAQAHGEKYVVCYPPAPVLAADELSALYALPFAREAHPAYTAPVPALEMVRWSITAVRGCGGGCSFCSLAQHQGRHLSSRPPASILHEVETLTQTPGWKGIVSDVGGPTANLWGAECQLRDGACRRDSCLSPQKCPQLRLQQSGYLELLRSIRDVPGVRHVFIGSGVRHDLALLDREFCAGLVGEFVSGQLKLAPEHCVERVLGLMRKTDFQLFERFSTLFGELCRECGREQYIIPYVMSAFPGCTAEDMQVLAAWFQARGWRPQQVQCFIPTPGTMATAMYYAGCDLQGRPLYVARSDREREDQHAILMPKPGGPVRSGRQASAPAGKTAWRKQPPPRPRH